MTRLSSITDDFEKPLTVSVDASPMDLGHFYCKRVDHCATHPDHLPLLRKIMPR